MRYPKASWLLCLTGVALLPFVSAWYRAPVDVDLALVIAVDVSTSMDPDEQDLQRQGYVEAFRQRHELRGTQGHRHQPREPGDHLRGRGRRRRVQERERRGKLGSGQHGADFHERSLPGD